MLRHSSKRKVEYDVPFSKGGILLDSFTSLQGPDKSISTNLNQSFAENMPKVHHTSCGMCVIGMDGRGVP